MKITSIDGVKNRINEFLAKPRAFPQDFILVNRAGHDMGQLALEFLKQLQAEIETGMDLSHLSDVEKLSLVSDVKTCLECISSRKRLEKKETASAVLAVPIFESYNTPDGILYVIKMIGSANKGSYVPDRAVLAKALEICDTILEDLRPKAEAELANKFG